MRWYAWRSIEVSARDQQVASRRSFLSAVAAGGSLIIGILAGLPAAWAWLWPARRRGDGSQDFVPILKLDALPTDGTPVRCVVQEEAPRDAWQILPPADVGTVYVRRRGDSVQAISSVCPHLGCGVRWIDRPGHRRFDCPCHESAFAPDGAVMAGPSPRPLDELPCRTRGGWVEVQYRRFRMGVPEKHTA